MPATAMALRSFRRLQCVYNSCGTCPPEKKFGFLKNNAQEYPKCIEVPKSRPQTAFGVHLGVGNASKTRFDSTAPAIWDPKYDVPHCGKRILSSVLRRKNRKPNPKKNVKEAVRSPSAKRALGTWRVSGCGGRRQLPPPRVLFMF